LKFHPFKLPGALPRRQEKPPERPDGNEFDKTFHRRTGEEVKASQSFIEELCPRMDV
jgi:hypothetical protein